MRRSSFTESQIVGALKEVEGGTPDGSTFAMRRAAPARGESDSALRNASGVRSQLVVVHATPPLQSSAVRDHRAQGSQSIYHESSSISCGATALVTSSGSKNSP